MPKHRERCYSGRVSGQTPFDGDIARAMTAVTTRCELEAMSNIVRPAEDADVAGGDHAAAPRDVAQVALVEEEKVVPNQYHALAEEEADTSP